MKGGSVKKLQSQLSLTEVAEEIVSFANLSFCPGGRRAGKSCNCYALQKCHFDLVHQPTIKESKTMYESKKFGSPRMLKMKIFFATLTWQISGSKSEATENKGCILTKKDPFSILSGLEIFNVI